MILEILFGDKGLRGRDYGDDALYKVFELPDIAGKIIGV